jgi:hypothetical protein
MRSSNSLASAFKASNWTHKYLESRMPPGAKHMESRSSDSEYATEPWIQSVSYSISHHVKGKDDQHDG